MEAVAAERRKLLPISDLAEWLGVSEATVYRLRDRAQDPLPSLKVGASTRFDPDEVSVWLSRQRKTSRKWEPRW